MARDYYEILGISRTASADEIKRAFRQLGKKYHPDVNSEPGAQEKFQEINEAYQVLSDPDKRRAYDRFGHAGVNFGGAGTSGFGGFTDFEDLFEDLMGAFGARTTRSNSRRPRQGRDLESRVRISFEQAIFGANLDIEVPRLEVCDACDGSGAAAGTQVIECPDCGGRGQIQTPRRGFLGTILTVSDCPRCRGKGKIVENPCQSCHGEGRVKQVRTFNITIPAGAEDRLQLRYSNQGEPGDNGGPNGHLYVTLLVEEHEFFKRRGSDIILEININMAQAALGDRIMIPTVYGEEELRIEPGTQAGTVITLRDKGVPKWRVDNRQSGGRGDQLCIVNVVIPTKLNAKQRALLEELGQSLGTELVANNSGKGIFDRVVNFFSGS